MNQTRILVVFCEDDTASFITLELEDQAEVDLVLSFHGKYLGDESLKTSEAEALESYFFVGGGRTRHPPSEEAIHGERFDHIIMTGVLP